MSRGESIRKPFAAISVALLAGIVAFAQSYRAWLDPIIDSGRDLYIPEQLRLGATLYHDILYYYPPLTPYLLAAITAVIGSSLGAYIAIGLATALLTALAIWMIVHPLAGELAASAALLIFFSFSMAGVGGWGSNYFFPYAHAATFAMLFFLWTAVTPVAAFESGASHEHGSKLAVIFLVAASWTKIEYALFSAVLLVFLVLTRRVRARALIAYVAANAVILIIATAVFGFPALRANILPPSLLAGASARAFYARVTGMNAWQANLMLAVRGALAIGVFIVLLYAWDRRPRLRVAISIAIAVAAVLLANDTFFRAWTILQLALVPFAVRRPREPLALLLLLSLCASSRIYLNIAPSWYGFVFITPVVLLMTYVFFEWLPQRGVYARTTAAAWALPFVLVASSGLLTAREAYRDAQPVITKRGVYADRSSTRATAMRELLAHLERIQARELVVMPEGLAINYLARIRTPLRYQTFTPVEIAGDEPAVLADFEAKQPQYVLLVDRDVREFGYQRFGIDYGRDIVSWMRTRYVIDRRFGAMVLLRRR